MAACGGPRLRVVWWCGECSFVVDLTLRGRTRRARDHPPPSEPTHPPALRRVCACGGCVVRVCTGVLVRCSCGAVQCGAVRSLRFGLVRCGAVRCGAVRCGVVWSGRRARVVVCVVVRCAAVWCAVRCGAVWCGVVGVRSAACTVLFSLSVWFFEPGRVEQARGAVRARRAGARQ